MVEDADIVLVTSGTTASTAIHTVKLLRKQGKKVGNLRMRVLRPFPFNDIRNYLKNAGKIVIIDRNISFGYHGIFSQEIKSALYGHSDVPVFSYTAGLGGRDIFPETIQTIVSEVERIKNPDRNMYWAELKQ